MNIIEKCALKSVPNFPRNLICFEKESYGKLCGVQCSYSLIHGPYFDAIILSEPGFRFDQTENSLNAEIIKDTI